MKESAKELKAEAAKADGESALLAKVADLAGSDEIQSTHLAEALQYRPKLMMG